MKKIYYFLISFVLISIITFAFLYSNATRYSKFANYKNNFDGPALPLTSFVLNSFNGFIMKNIPEKYSTPFIDWKEIIPEAQILIDNFEKIKNEYSEVLKKYEEIPEYDKLDSHQGSLSNHDAKKWKTFVFKYHSGFNAKNCNMCPETSKLLKKLPVELAMFSIMEKGKKLFPHRGPSKHILRLHLGIDIPEKAKITVDKKDYFWKEKELVLFDDTYEHSVDNPNGLRGVLFMDIDRKHIPKKYIWIANLVGKQYFTDVNKKVEEKAKIL